MKNSIIKIKQLNKAKPRGTMLFGKYSVIYLENIHWKLIITLGCLSIYLLRPWGKALLCLRSLLWSNQTQTSGVLECEHSRKAQALEGSKTPLLTGSSFWALGPWARTFTSETLASFKYQTVRRGLRFLGRSKTRACVRICRVYWWPHQAPMGWSNGHAEGPVQLNWSKSWT